MNFQFKKSNKPIIIAGPCSAETEEQVFLVTEALKNINQIDVLRAGIWKPRTRPNHFEGIGEEGIDWLVQAGKQYNLPVTIEVANAKHVEIALKKGVDILWIGARTTVNPFSVQEIADALKGVSIPVMVKNPLNPDLQLWVGAIERLMNSGITNLAAIHRGFSSYEKNKYRNEPKWGIPIDLMRIFPDLPIICDPSHIAGNRDLIQEIAQKALDMNMSGLMIETHPNPDSAWSDAQQQITPSILNEILNQLTIRTEIPDNLEILNDLEELRSQIDEIDESIIKLLANRKKVIEKIAHHKKENQLTILQAKRWFEILKTRKDYGKKLGLDEEFIDVLLKSIHKESVKIQTEIMNDKKKQ